MFGFDKNKSKSGGKKGSYIPLGKSCNPGAGQLPGSPKIKDSSVSYDWEGEVRQIDKPAWNAPDHRAEQRRLAVQTAMTPPPESTEVFALHPKWFFGYKGRLARKGYVQRLIVVAIILLICDFLVRSAFSFTTPARPLAMLSDPLVVVTLLVAVVMLLSLLSLQARRMHDLGLSALWLIGEVVLFALLPFVYGGVRIVCIVVLVIVNLVFMAFHGTYGPNAYGPDPIIKALGELPDYEGSRFRYGRWRFLADIIEVLIRWRFF